MEASWAPLGASWGVFGASWGHLGASWGVLAASWRVLEIKSRLGSVLEASWALKSLQDKPDLTWNGKRRSFWRLALGRFSKRSWIAKAPQCSANFSEKAPKIDPKTSQNRTQDAPKSRSGGGSVGDRVSIPNRSPNSPLLGVSWGVLGASWARLGAVLELSWSVLGRLARILGASGDVLGASWNVLRILHEN